MQPCQLALNASAVAQSDPALSAVAPSWILALINLLLPGIPALFTSCLGPTPTPSAVQQNLTAAYDEGSGTYSNACLHSVSHQARVKSIQAGNKITRSQADAIAQHTLDAARIADVPTLTAAMAMPSV